MRKTLFFAGALLSLVLVCTLTSAVIVQSVQAPSLTPGRESSLIVTITNTLEDTVEDVSIALVLNDVPFISGAGSEKSTNELRDGRDKSFSFVLKPAYDATPGDYQIPYEISYTMGNERFTRKGSLGVHVEGAPELRVTLDSTTPVIGMNDQIVLTLVNEGLAEARFVSITVRGEGITLLSDKEVYVGSVDSDDFETVSFDVRYTKAKATLVASVTYRDLDNNRLNFEKRLSLSVYTREEAISKRIIARTYTKYYIGVAALVVFIWFVWRMIRKRRRARLSASH